MAVDSTGNIYFTDEVNQAIDYIPYSNGSYGNRVTLAQDYAVPVAIAVDTSGNVFVANESGNTIQKLPAGGGSLTTVISGLNHPTGVAVDASGNLYIADTY